MENLLIILALLAVALWVLVTLLEKFAKPKSAEEMRALSRYVLPLMALLALLQLLFYWFSK